MKIVTKVIKPFRSVISDKNNQRKIIEFLDNFSIISMPCMFIFSMRHGHMEHLIQLLYYSLSVIFTVVTTVLLSSNYVRAEAQQFIDHTNNVANNIAQQANNVADNIVQQANNIVQQANNVVNNIAQQANSVADNIADNSTRKILKNIMSCVIMGFMLNMSYKLLVGLATSTLTMQFAIPYAVCILAAGVGVYSVNRRQPE